MNAGETLGPYRIDRELGSGGMGRVHAATGPEGVVALKVVHPHLLEVDGAVERFRREIEIGRTVRHRNVVRTLDGGEAEGHHYLVMEYVEGQTLDAMLAELGRFPEELCRHVGREVTKGLAAIHGTGVLHRDIKPENVLITPEHDVKIMDLGVARMMDDALRLSQTGAFVGSLRYAAPECFRPELGKPDHRADLHALGLVLYELATGDAPYAAPDVHASILRVLEDLPRRCGELNPQLSPFFEEIVHTLLVKDPRGRFSTAEELFDALTQGEAGTWWRGRAKALRVATKKPLRRVRIPRETALYGRDGELATLRALYDSAAAGSGRVVLIEGEAGIGKSRLVDEFVGRMQAEGEDLNFLFGGYPPNGAATAEGAFSEAFREQFGEEGCASYLPRSPSLVPAFDALLRRENPPPGTSRLERAAVQMCFAQALAALAAERPTVVLIDDLHFAPDRARALFTALATEVRGARVLLIGTTRPTDDTAWSAAIERFEHTARLSPQRLTPPDVAALLEDALRSKVLAAQLGYQIVVKSNGNPFFAFEIIRGLREGRLITQRGDGTWTSTRVVDEIEVPSSIADIVNARVAALDDESRNLLDVAACLGFEFDASLLAEAVGMSRIPLLQALARIEKRERLIRSVGRRFAFDHHQIQEVLYESMPELLREEYHGAIGDVLLARCPAQKPGVNAPEARLVVEACEHLVRATRWNDALTVLDGALDALLWASRLPEVASLAERVLAVPGLLAGEPRAFVLLRLFDARHHAASLEECERIIDEAGQHADAAGSSEGQTQVAMIRGSLLRSRGDLAGALASHRRALALAQEHGDAHAEAGSIVNVGNILMEMGRLPEARDHYERGLQHARAAKSDRFACIALSNLGSLASREDRISHALAWTDEALALTRALGDKPLEARFTAGRGEWLSILARREEAREAFAAAVAMGTEVGDLWSVTEALLMLGDVLSEEGDADGARDALEGALQRCERSRHAEHEIGARTRLGALLVEQGESEAGRRNLERACELAGRVGMASHGALAAAHLAAGDPARLEDARAAVTQAWDGMRAAVRRDAAWLLYRASGERDDLIRAREALDEVLRRVDPEDAARMRTGLRRHREILAAWREAFGEDDGPTETGSESRAG